MGTDFQDWVIKNIFGFYLILFFGLLTVEEAGYHVEKTLKEPYDPCGRK